MTIVMFVAMLLECSYKRKEEKRILDKITTIVTKTLEDNQVFKSNEEKAQSIAALMHYKEDLNEIAFQDTLISIICGNSDDMTKRIFRAKDAVNSQIIRIDRLNNYIDSTYSIDSSIPSNNIHIQAPFTNKLNTLNLIFSIPNVNDSILATQVLVYVENHIVFNKQYEYKRVNSVTIPQTAREKRLIRIGYIMSENNKYIFKYSNYGK